MVTKKELITAIAKKSGFTKKDIKVALEATTEVFKELIIDGLEVPFGDLGRFSTSVRAERTCPNIHTGATMVIPEHKVPRFKPSAMLKDMVNE